MEKLKDFDKQLDEQATTLANQIQQLEAQLTTAKNTYMKVLGAIEIVQFLKKEVEHPPEEEEKIDIAEVT